ncbi:hypothetical protein SISSUDRAFT_1053746 [Sistotremastrum suecicum HHB10207 ss-3]|uniref:Uncharacterized protein n=1 Tax=Sistotremastrum suecicum HHB10207 ss-3 TaxID=1314776 RepID=A0A165Z174_9AGAM|nr:hypothetical protein SISSUDRAFT_1053746 [Sistotremastrum suecicum HHB10207 ss-3]
MSLSFIYQPFNPFSFVCHLAHLVLISFCYVTVIYSRFPYWFLDAADDEDDAADDPFDATTARLLILHSCQCARGSFFRFVVRSAN